MTRSLPVVQVVRQTKFESQIDGLFQVVHCGDFCGQFIKTEHTLNFILRTDTRPNKWSDSCTDVPLHLVAVI